MQAPGVVGELGVEVEAEVAEKFFRSRQVFDRQVHKYFLGLFVLKHLFSLAK
jgi:hypothetical protein